MILQSPTISGSVELTGPLEIIGSISASYFEGDGSGLTGLQAALAVVQYSEIINKPTLVSGSSQVTFDGLSGKPANLISASGNNIDAPGNFIPTVNEQYDLGSVSLRWRDLYLSGSTIYLGDTKLSRNVDGDLEVKDRVSNSRKKIIAEEVIIGSGADAFKMKTIGGRVRFVKESDESIESRTLATGSFSGSFNGNIYGIDNDNKILFNSSNISFFLGGTEEFRMSSNGDFHADGDIIGNSTTIASDLNLKEDINTIINPIDKLTNINGVTFKWKKDGKESIGVIAQEIEKVFPQLVTKVSNLNKEGEHLTVNYSGLIGVLIESVKELQSQVTDLKNQLTNTKDGTTE